MLCRVLDKTKILQLFAQIRNSCTFLCICIFFYREAALCEELQIEIDIFFAIEIDFFLPILVPNNRKFGWLL